MHDEVRELLGVYALDALDSDERESVTAHLTICPDCQAEVEQHREVAAMLGGADQAAPAKSWEGIAAEISEDEPYEQDAVVIPLYRRTRVLATAAAILILFLGASLIVQTIRLTDAQTVSAAGLDDVVAEVLKDDTTTLMTLSSADSEASALVAFQPDGTGYLVRHTLPVLAVDSTYQLWAVVDGTVISAGVLGADPGIVPFHIDPEGLDAFAITAEVAGGVVASENDAVVVWVAA